MQRCDVAPPRIDRIGLVEARDGSDLRPESIGVRLSEEAPCPALGRARDHRPGGRQAGRQVARDLPRAPRLGPCGTRRIDVREQLWIRVAERDDERGPLGAEPGGLEPRRSPVEQRVRRVERVQAADVVVDVEAVDVPGPRSPAGLGDRAEQGSVLRLAEGDELLPLLQVDADPNGELGVARHVVHRATISPPGTRRQPPVAGEKTSSRESQTGS